MITTVDLQLIGILCCVFSTDSFNNLFYCCYVDPAVELLFLRTATTPLRASIPAMQYLRMAFRQVARCCHLAEQRMLPKRTFTITVRYRFATHNIIDKYHHQRPLNIIMATTNPGRFLVTSSTNMRPNSRMAITLMLRTFEKEHQTNINQAIIYNKCLPTSTQTTKPCMALWVNSSPNDHPLDLHNTK